MNHALSVIIPNYNHGHVVERAIDSVLEQRVSPREIIIVDDASTDGSLEKVERIAKRSALIKVISRAANGGAIAAGKDGIAASSGDWLAFCAADDFLLPGFIENYMRAVEIKPTAGIVVSDAAWIFESGEQTITKLPFGSGPAFFEPEQVAIIESRAPFFIPGHASIYRKAALLEAGGFLERMRWHCDWLMNFVLAFRHGLIYLPGVYSVFKSSRTSYSSAGIMDKEQQHALIYEIMNEIEAPQYEDVRMMFWRSGAPTTLPRFAEVVEECARLSVEGLRA